MALRDWTALLLLPLSLLAAEKDAELGLGVDSDNVDGRGAHADLALTIADKHKISFSHQNSRSTFAYLSPCTGQYALALVGHSSRPLRDALARFPEQEIETKNRDDSWSYSYLGEPFGGGIRGSRFDGGDGLESKELSLNGYWQGEQWDVALDGSRRDTDFALEFQRLSGTVVTPQCNSTFYSDRFSSRGLGLTLGYTFDNGWRVYGASMGYQSDFDLPQNISYETLLLRSVNGGGLSTALTKTRRSIGLQIPFEHFWLGLEAGNEQSLVDESTIRFSSAWLVWSINASWELELSVASTSLDLGDEAQSDEADKLRSSSVGLRWYW